MAKLSQGIIKINGKLDDMVFVRTKTGTYIRKAVKPGSKKNEEALMRQNGRTKFLNRLAGKINEAIGNYLGRFKSRGFYLEIQKRFRKEPEDNRFFLLMQLKGMDANPDYPLHKLGIARTTVREAEKNIIITVKTEYHPPQVQEADSYYYEVILLSWSRKQKKKDPPNAERQLSDWVAMPGELEHFEFEFDKPEGTVHWLLFLRLRLGVRKREIENFPTDSTRVMDAGSFDEAEQQLWAEKQAGILAKLEADRIRKPKEEVPRVKAKKKE